MKDFLMICAVALCALFAGINGTILVMTYQKPACECPCCKPDETKPHRPLRPNGSMPGSTGSIGSLQSK